MRVIGLIGFVAGTALAVGSACKSTPSGNGNGCASTGALNVVTVGNTNAYTPAIITISPGQKVCWENDGSGHHTVTSDSIVGDSSWSIDAQLENNLTVVYDQFTKVGVDYPYHCFFHKSQGMTGIIKVR